MFLTPDTKYCKRNTKQLSQTIEVCQFLDWAQEFSLMASKLVALVLILLCRSWVFQLLIACWLVIGIGSSWLELLLLAVRFWFFIYQRCSSLLGVQHGLYFLMEGVCWVSLYLLVSFDYFFEELLDLMISILGQICLRK